MPSSYAIGRHFEEFIDRLLASGRYANASEVVRAGLRLLEEHEEDLQRRRAEIWKSIDESIADLEQGRSIPADEVFAELRELIRQSAAKRDAAE